MQHSSNEKKRHVSAELKPGIVLFVEYETSMLLIMNVSALFNICMKHKMH